MTAALYGIIVSIVYIWGFVEFDCGAQSRERLRNAGKRGAGDIPAVLVLSRNRQLDLDAVNAVDAVNEQNQDEDECNLHPILHFCNDWTLGDEAAKKCTLVIGSECLIWVGSREAVDEGRNVREQLPLDGEGKGHQKEHEKPHLRHEQHKHL